ncbi:phage head morphogenesis protein, partial [Kingella kingae]|nr:phage head morphogenesis protein [Kingella kingae]MDK4631561.1 phage head morphogenesis protein [Kingella kingae]MDK4667248.1 phage head morphogenesis protein [Kingella kingae]
MTAEDIKVIFGMQPENAIAYLKQKRVDVSWDWQEMLDDAHVSAFTVAKTAGMDVANDIHQAVVKAAEQGQPFKDFER